MNHECSIVIKFVRTLYDCVFLDNYKNDLHIVDNISIRRVAYLCNSPVRCILSRKIVELAVQIATHHGQVQVEYYC